MTHIHLMNNKKENLERIIVWTYLLQVTHPLGTIMSVHTKTEPQGMMGKCHPLLYKAICLKNVNTVPCSPPVILLTTQADKWTCCGQQSETRDMSSSIKVCIDCLHEWWTCDGASRSCSLSWRMHFDGCTVIFFAKKCIRAWLFMCMCACECSCHVLVWGLNTLSCYFLPLDCKWWLGVRLCASLSEARMCQVWRALI